MEIKDVTKQPVVLIDSIASTNCMGTPNGQITATVSVSGSPVTTGYKFEWFEGTDASASGTKVTTTSAENNIAQQLQGGNTYTVKVTNLATGCITERPVALPDSSALPVVTTTHLDNSICDPALTSPATAYNGSITAAVTYKTNPVDLAKYSFNWYQGTDFTTAVTITGTDSLKENLAPGTYWVTTTNTLLGCTSIPVKVEIKDVTKQPVVLIDSIASTNCMGTPNGQITATVSVSGSPVTTGYKFEWFEGN